MLAEVIEFNAANYTAWQFRRHCLREMHKSSEGAMRTAAWQRELDYCTEMCLDNMKNYQVWFHRRACIDALQQPAGELAFVGRVLQEDSKNYHAWGHRQWVLKTFNLWEGELLYVDQLLQQDLRNNSAWNQRYFVLQHTSDLKGDLELLKREADTALLHIARAPSNPSPWAYLRGIAEPVGYSKLPQVRAACEKLGTATAAAATQADGGEEEGGGGGSSSSGPCVEALALLVDILLEPNSEERDAKRAGELCEQLKALDPIRERYWTWRAARAATAAPAREAEAEAAPMLGRMVGGKASLPPWWISAGVKPAGGEVDMGGWKAISFTEGQQKQFGIDSTGAVVDKVLHEAALAALRAGALPLEVQ